MYLTQGIHRALQQRGDGIATIFQGRRQTWRSHRDRVARLAAGLRALGVGAGDRVMLIAHNSDLYIEAVNAIAWAGAVVVPANFRWTEREHADALADSDARVLIVDAPLGDMGRGLAAELGLSGLVLLQPERTGTTDGVLSTEDLIDRHRPIDDQCGRDDALAGIYYTGGTTGRAKGVMLSHRNLIANVLGVIATTGAPEQRVFLHSSPLFHIGGASAALGITLLGGTHVVLPAFTPEAAVKAIEQEQVTWALIVPTMFAMIRDYLAEHPADLRSVRRIRYGASAISETLLRDAMWLFPNAEFQQGYGQTELAAAATVLEPQFHLLASDKPYLRSAGRSLAGTDVRIADENLVERPLGQIGEIVVRGPGVMLGYWKQPDLTAATIVDGWLRTGDAGYMDDEGFVYIADRLKDMIVSGGENVFSAEVENALAAHPKIAECAIIGVPDSKWGERVHAIVRFKPGMIADLAELVEHCRIRIAAYKCPRSLEARDAALPLSPQGKVLKTELRKPYWADSGRQIG